MPNQILEGLSLESAGIIKIGHNVLAVRLNVLGKTVLKGSTGVPYRYVWKLIFGKYQKIVQTSKIPSRAGIYATSGQMQFLMNICSFIEGSMSLLYHILLNMKKTEKKGID